MRVTRTCGDVDKLHSKPHAGDYQLEHPRLHTGEPVVAQAMVAATDVHARCTVKTLTALGHVQAGCTGCPCVTETGHTKLLT